MFHDDFFSRKHSAAKLSNTAKAIRDTSRLELLAKFFDRSVYQKFKHKCHTVRKMKIVQSNMDFVETTLTNDIINTINSFFSF